MNVFTFVRDTGEFRASDACIGRIAGDIRTAQQLFERYAAALSFPSYFGFNWNALFDCLRDFHWINEAKVVVVHDDLPGLLAEEMRTYLEVLRDAICDWRPGEAHSLQAVFNERDRHVIDAALSTH
ncbi:barstar family protein [Paraburkholderia sp. JPY419]|uniref:barstar family protein n=1 Tax=Paraburkholderia sp. JPY419 TaxID=667660 RepID=UPI003D218E62